MKENIKKQILQTAKEVLNTESKAIADVARSLNLEFSKVVEKIYGCKGRVIIVGIGKSGIIGRKISSTLSSTGTPSIFIHPVECLHGDLGALTREDIVIAMSNSGQTTEINNLIPILKNMGIFTIAMTGIKNSGLAKLADAVIYVLVKRQACPLNIAPTTSTTAMLSVGDAIAVALMKLKKFTKKDFARIHPAGSIGKILNLKVSDLMIKGKNNPVIEQDKTVKQALIVMTKTHMGAVSVVDAKGKLTGFFTDGDLRRNFQKKSDILDFKISKIMTKNPVTISSTAMAADAARIISVKNIDNIPVINDKKEPVGLLDERNLLEVLPSANDEN